MPLPLKLPFELGAGSGNPTFAERLIAKLEPWNTGPVVNGKTDLERWCNAVGAMFQPALDLAEEEGSDGEAGYVPPYGRLFDPATCPKAGLPYLGMYVGVALPVGGSEEEWRALVKAESGLARGTLSSLEALLKIALGVVPFTVLERTNPVTAVSEAYALTIIVPTGHLAAAVYEQVNHTIPAGIVWGVIERAGTWFAGTKKWSEIEAGLRWSELKEGEY